MNGGWADEREVRLLHTYIIFSLMEAIAELLWMEEGDRKGRLWFQGWEDRCHVPGGIAWCEEVGLSCSSSSVASGSGRKSTAGMNACSLSHDLRRKIANASSRMSRVATSSKLVHDRPGLEDRGLAYAWQADDKMHKPAHPCTASCWPRPLYVHCNTLTTTACSTRATSYWL